MTRRRRARAASVADPYQDLLSGLDEGRRQGWIQRLAMGYYDGWHPTRSELAEMIDLELGRAARTSGGVASGGRTSSGGPALSSGAAIRPAASRSPAVNRPDRSGSSAGTPRAVLSRPDSLLHNAFGGDVRASTARSALPSLPPGSQVFSADCGVLAPPFRLQVRGLSRDGTAWRDHQELELVSLHYELVPPASISSAAFRPVFFTGAIECVPDIQTAREPGDGRSSSHIVCERTVIGSRGPWPISVKARRVTFVLSERCSATPTMAGPPGTAAAADAAVGELVLDLVTGSCVWRSTRPVGSSSTMTGLSA